MEWFGSDLASFSQVAHDPSAVATELVAGPKRRADLVIDLHQAKG